MKALFALAALALIPAPLLAAKLESRKMTCRDVSGIVDEKKSATIYYSKKHFSKFYAYSGFCDDRASMPAYLPTLDNPSCFVGYSCGPTYRAENRNGGGISVIGASAPYEENASSGQ